MFALSLVFVCSRLLVRVRLWIIPILCGFSNACVDYSNRLRIIAVPCGLTRSSADCCMLVRIFDHACGYSESFADYFADKIALLNYYHS